MRIQKVAASVAALAVGGALAVATGTAAGAGPDRPAKPPTCRGGQLHTSLGPVDAAAGSYYQNVRFRNTKRRCVVRGWPNVRYARKGGPIGHFAAHRRKPPHRLVLRHGEVGRVTLQTPNWRNFPRKRCHAKRATHVVTHVPKRVKPATRHRNKLKRPMKVCSSMQGRPRIARMR